MKTNEWITDRLPSKADANEYGHIARADKRRDCGWYADHSGQVKLGDPWAPWPRMPLHEQEKALPEIHITP